MRFEAACLRGCPFEYLPIGNFLFLPSCRVCSEFTYSQAGYAIDNGSGRRQNYPSSIDHSSQPSSQPQPFQLNTQAILAIQYLLFNSVDPPKLASMITNDGLDMIRRSDPRKSLNEPASSSMVSQTQRSHTLIPSRLPNGGGMASCRR